MRQFIVGRDFFKQWCFQLATFLGLSEYKGCYLSGADTRRAFEQFIISEEQHLGYPLMGFRPIEGMRLNALMFTYSMPHPMSMDAAMMPDVVIEICGCEQYSLLIRNGRLVTTVLSAPLVHSGGGR